MKTKTFKISTLLILVFTISLLRVTAQQEISDNKTLSPYFFVKSDNPGVDQLPLKSTRADVNIAGVIADVKVTQVYKNEGTTPLEAIYIFPGSTRAAVYGMKMTIGERTVIAKIEEAGKARQDYEEAMRQGKTASLLEQQRPNVFQMNVANIMPGEKIKVELSYTELLIPEEGVYEFVYPTVVGPRYSNTPEDLASKNEMWVSNPYTKEGEQPFYSFDLNLKLNAGLPVEDVICTTHDVSINFESTDKVEIDLKDNEKFGGNRDFVLNYRLQGNQIESGLLLFEGKDENFFLAMIQPPKHIKPENIPPREYIFIVDVSGSMSGFPLDVSKSLLKDLIGNLRTIDKFNVLLFAGSSRFFSQHSLEANSSNIKKAIDFLNNQRGGGGTELLPALRRALAMQGTENYSRTFIIATDGYVTVEKEAFDLIRKNLGEANFFTFGIGSSVNRLIIEGMAHVGKGSPFVVLNQNEATEMADKFRKYIEKPVLTNIKMKFNGFEVYDIEPFEVPDVFSERPVLVYGKYKGNPSGTIELKGNTGFSKIQQRLEVNRFKPDKSNSALKYLWAREKIRILDDYTNLAQNSEHVDEITAMGLKYNLLTAYTSFVAIDSEVRNNSENVTTVNQPLPLPKGVSNYAIGAQKSMGAIQSVRSGCNKVDGALHEYIGLDYSEPETAIDEEPVLFSETEAMPEFIGGEKALKEFIRQNLKYPQEARDNEIYGTVFIEFTVNPDGTIKDISVSRGVHSLLNKEAIRVIKLTGGKWKPGKQNGKMVKMKMVVSVKFEI
ncbi:MAG: hypothetical protein B6D61_13945 [Bacteroidetes bacterium 4484_249]|nr:MAG: hypothetical protein B6D61_13945 [Bacteroidetes bacterium 4484_249]